MPSPLDQPEAATPTSQASEADQISPSAPEALATHAAPLAIEAGAKEQETELVNVLDVGSGEPVKLDRLGPIIINADGTLSRIQNWQELHPIEQERTVRLLVKKRNVARLEKLDAENKAEAKDESMGLLSQSKEKDKE